MSDPEPGSRPRQVTLAGWLAMGGSALVVLLVFDRLAGLHTLETRAAVEKFIAEPPGSDFGVSVDAVLDGIRLLAMVTAGCATAAAVLGYHVLRRNRAARLALTVVAVPLFLAGLVTGGFVSTIVAASVVMLWLQPSRDWFDGITRAQPTPVAPAASPTVGTPTPLERQLPPPAPAARVVRPLAVSPYAVVGPPAPAPDRGPRPSPVAVACVVTWVATGLTALGMLLTGVALAVRPDTLLAEAHRQNPELEQQGVSDHLLLGATYAMVAVIVLWCLAAAVLAVLVFRGVEWARVVLVVSAAVAAALSLIGTALGAFVLVLTLLASGAAVALLLRSDARAWFRRPPGR